jgi:hypothetical protein
MVSLPTTRVRVVGSRSKWPFKKKNQFYTAFVLLVDPEVLVYDPLVAAERTVLAAISTMPHCHKQLAEPANLSNWSHDLPLKCTQ